MRLLYLYVSHWESRGISLIVLWNTISSLVICFACLVFDFRLKSGSTCRIVSSPCRTSCPAAARLMQCQQSLGRMDRVRHRARPCCHTCFVVGVRDRIMSASMKKDPICSSMQILERNFRMKRLQGCSKLGEALDSS